MQIKSTSFNVWVRYFVWNFKGTLWNSTQNILPIHWKIWFLYNMEILRALRFKSSEVFLKRPPAQLHNVKFFSDKQAMPCLSELPRYNDHLRWNYSPTSYKYSIIITWCWVLYSCRKSLLQQKSPCFDRKSPSGNSCWWTYPLYKIFWVKKARRWNVYKLCI